MMEKVLAEILTELRLLREQSKPTREIMNVPQAAEYLGQKEGTLRDWIRMRKIPHFKVNGSIKFKKSRLDRWLDRGAVPLLNRND